MPQSLWGFLLSTCLPLSSLLLGDICSLMIMSFISACVSLCRPDSRTRVGSLGCVQSWIPLLTSDNMLFEQIFTGAKTQSLQGYPTRTPTCATMSMFNSPLRACEALIMIHCSLFSSLLPSAFSSSPPYPPLASSLTSVKDDSDGAHTAKLSLSKLLD